MYASVSKEERDQQSVGAERDPGPQRLHRGVLGSWEEHKGELQNNHREREPGALDAQPGEVLEIPPLGQGGQDGNQDRDHHERHALSLPR